MKKLENLDNITDETLDLIVEKFKNNKQFRIVDDRKKIVFDKPREYFLFANSGFNMNRSLEWTFIWIGKNLWQFRYCNTECNYKSSWKNPLDLLNELLKS